MSGQIPMKRSERADLGLDGNRDGAHEVATDVAYKRLAIVNVVMIGEPNAGDRGWVLVDAGMPGSAGMIHRAAERRFGDGARPRAILVTHGHFDHVGALKTLAKKWEAPIFAHELEIPYLNGGAAYPPPDAKVGGGLMTLLSPLFSRGPIDVSNWLSPYPGDGAVPGLPEWRWVHTPGHTPGHVSLWRESDRMLVVGDAFITTRQESAYAALMQTPEMHGPPMYFTQDWDDARESVEKLAALNPDIVVCGHGAAMRGGQMRAALASLARNFGGIAVPERGRYVKDPATVEAGTAYERV